MALDDAARARYLRDRVLTATPAQRVIMLYDRLGLDFTRASEARDHFDRGRHVSHAIEVLAELRASLDLTVGGPAENLAELYGFMLGESIAARSGSGNDKLLALREIAASLREAWAQASELTSITATPRPAAVGSWVG